MHDGSELIGPAEPFSDFLADSLSDCSSEGTFTTHTPACQSVLVYSITFYLYSMHFKTESLRPLPQSTGISAEQTIGPSRLSMEVRASSCPSTYFDAGKEGGCEGEGKGGKKGGRERGRREGEGKVGKEGGKNKGHRLG